MEKVKIKFIEDFTSCPGGRSRETGDSSAEEFYEDVLRGKYIEAQEKDVKISIDLDGAAGYAGSFLDEAFGRLGFEFGYEDVKDRVEFVTDEEPYLREDIMGSVEEWSVDGIHYNSALAKGKEMKENNYFTSVKKKKKK